MSCSSCLTVCMEALKRFCQLLAGVAALTILGPFYLLYKLAILAQDNVARRAFTNGYDTPFGIYIVIALCVLLNGLRLDGQWAWMPQWLCFSPVLLANLEALRRYFLYLVGEGYFRCNDDHMFESTLSLFMLVLWNVQFWIFGFRVGENMKIVVQLVPILLLLCVYLFLATKVLVEDDGATPAWFHFFLFWAPLMAQVVLIAEKMDGSIGAPWSEVLVPWWIFVTGMLAAMLFYAQDDGLESHTNRARFICACVAFLGFIVTLANVCEATFEPPTIYNATVIDGQEVQVVDGNATARAAASFSPPTILSLNLPIIVAADLLLFVRLLIVMVPWTVGCRQWIGAVRTRLAQRHAEHEVQAKRRSVGAPQSTPLPQVANATQAPESATDTTDVVVHVVAEEDECNTDTPTVIEPPQHRDAAGQSLPDIVVRACEVCEAAKSAEEIVEALKHLRKIVLADPHRQTTEVRARIVGIGRHFVTRSTGGSEWTAEARVEFGKLLRCMHPVNRIRRTLAYVLRHSGRALSNRAFSGRFTQSPRGSESSADK